MHSGTNLAVKESDGLPPDVPAVLNSQTSLELSSTRRSLRNRQDVYVPLVFHKGKYVAFKRKHLLFLDAYKPGVTLAHAAEQAGLTTEGAMRFLRRKDVRLWLHDLAKEAAIKRDWDRPEKWYAMAEEWLNGGRPYQEDGRDIEIWKALGDRVVPKPTRANEQTAQTKIEININPDSIDKALQRQKSIEADLADAKQ